MGEHLEKCLCIHAETRAVLQNSRGCQDSTLYITEETVSNVLTYFISWNRKGCLFRMTRTEKRNIYSEIDPVRIIKRRFTEGKTSEEEYEELKKAIEL
jgi:hypothetical protein